jgi:protoheme ferro-lyase
VQGGLREVLPQALHSFTGDYDKIMFRYHGLPEGHMREGDATIQRLADATNTIVS